jgi:2,3-bisphosphoglycerate-independent phosphoglycerate mutase
MPAVTGMTEVFMRPKPFVLIVLDGFGYRADLNGNAIANARTPHWSTLWNMYPHALLSASGTDVGLPAGQMGNSEVGHLNIGAGRIVYQDSLRISDAIQNDTFSQNLVLQKTIQAIHPSHRLHLLGLLSDGGVHSLQTHLEALIQLCQHTPTTLHLFLDGRDTPPKSALTYLKRLETFLKPYPQVQIGSLIGRYYAMDRDNRLDRTQLAYQCLTEKSDIVYSSAIEAVEASYQAGITDEFIRPIALPEYHPIQAGDVVICFNFRADRMRQLAQLLTQTPTLSAFTTLTHYSDKLPATVAFPPIRLKNTLGEILSHQNLTQWRLAETEKYAHVTFFFNGGDETAYPGEKRCLIPSPRVATYDLKPEMSAFPLTDALVEAVQKKRYDVIICNYANADMVGHTGLLEATTAAIEVLDTCLGKVVAALQDVGGEALITADHGNAELMFDPLTQQPHTAHTVSPVPLLYVGTRGTLIPEGRLCDVAPTLLDILKLPQPSDMTGKSLLR